MKNKSLLITKALAMLLAFVVLFFTCQFVCAQEGFQLPQQMSQMTSAGMRSTDPYHSDDEPWEWHIRPKGFTYGTYWASTAEPRLATQVAKDLGQQRSIDSQIGGRIGLLRFGPKDHPEGFQLDVLGGVMLRQQGGSLDLLGSDFRYDILGTYREGQHGLKFGFYHISAHTGDEFLLANPEFERLEFKRDALVVGYSYYSTPKLRLYAETSWAYRRNISEPWEFQFGFDYGPQHPTGVRGAPFFALNGRLREELDFGGNLALQTGWAWRGEDLNDGILRTGLHYYNGKSPQFSFFNRHEQQIGWGLWYDY